MLQVCDKTPSIIHHGTAIIRDILENHQKVIYRCLFLSRPGITNPVLRLLTIMTTYHKGECIENLFQTIDFSVKAFPKIMSSLKGDSDNGMRRNFLQFYLSFIDCSSFIIRKDLISQRKIISNWFKNLSSDNEDIILHTLSTLKDKIVLDVSFTKSSKISFFNDWITGSLIKLFSLSDSIRTKVYELLSLLCTDLIHGIRFPDKGWYQLISVSKVDLESIKNRPAFSILKQLKPWEDLFQQDLAVKILETCPELNSPYFSAISSTMNFDPKLSSFWVSFVTFHSRVIKLSIPNASSASENTETGPSDYVVSESVLPSTITKGALTKCFQDNNPLIIYFSAEILLNSLEKLFLVKKWYSTKLLDSSTLFEIIENKLPELPLLSKTLSNTKDTNKLLKTTLLKAISLYSELFSDIFLNTSGTSSSGPTAIIDDLQKNADKLAGLDLIQARAALDIQGRISKVGKWWNKSGEYSMFTNLLRLGNANNHLSKQVTRMLTELVFPTLLFQQETFVQPILSLVHSLDLLEVIELTEGELTKLWKLIDESVARCMRSPYRYVDEFASYRDDSDIESVLSPFIVTLLEQWKFVEEPRKGVDNWLRRFLQVAVVSGESFYVIQKLTEKAGLGKFTLNNKFTDSFVEFVTNASATKIKQDNRRIDDVLDLQAAKKRVLIESEPNELVNHLFSKIPVHLAHHLVDRKFFVEFLSSNLSSSFFSRLHELWQVSMMDLTTVQDFVRKITDTHVLADGLWLLKFEDVSAIALNTTSLEVFKVSIRYHTENGYPVNSLLVPRLSDFNYDNDEIEELLKQNITAHGSKISSSFERRLLAVELLNRSYYDLLAALIRNGGFGEAEEVLSSTNTKVQAAISRYSICGNHIPPSGVVKGAMSEASSDSFAILSKAVSNLQTEDLTHIVKMISNLSGNLTVSPDVMKVAGILLEKGYQNELQKWVKKCVLWLTKCFTGVEDKTQLYSAIGFLSVMNSELKERKFNLWSMVPSRQMNTLIDTGLLWIDFPDIVEFLTILVFSGGDSVECTKHLQILLSQKLQIGSNEIVSLLLWKLYMGNPKAHSTVTIQESILLLCGGTNAPHDSILLDIIKRIEGYRNISWASRVITWTFRAPSAANAVSNIDDYELLPLFNNTNHGIEVTLDVQTIKNSVRNYSPDAVYELPGLENGHKNLSFNECLESIKEFKKTVVDGVKKCYDMEFLLMTMVNVPDIFRDHTSLDIKLFVETWGLSFVICCLSSKFSDVAKTVIEAVLQTKDTSYKERDAVKLLLGKLMTSFYNDEAIPPCICIIMAMLLPIATNPGHFMFPKVAKFLLSGPELHYRYLPMHNLVTEPTEDSTREISWYLDLLTCSLTTRFDLLFMIRLRVFEWFLNLSGVSSSLAVNDFIKKAQEVPGGAYNLITRNGALSWSEIEFNEAKIQYKSEITKLNLRYVFAADRKKLDKWVDNDVGGLMRRLDPTYRNI